MTNAEQEEQQFEQFAIAFNSVPGAVYQSKGFDPARSGARFISFSYDADKALLVFGSRNRSWTRLYIRPEYRHKSVLENVFRDVLETAKKTDSLLYFFPQPFELKSVPTDLLQLRNSDYIFDRRPEAVEALTKLYLRVGKKLGRRLERCNRLGEKMLRYWP